MDTNQQAIKHHNIQVGDFVEVEPDAGGENFIMQVTGIDQDGRLHGEGITEDNEPINHIVNAYEVTLNLETS